MLLDPVSDTIVQRIRTLNSNLRNAGVRLEREKEYIKSARDELRLNREAFIKLNPKLDIEEYVKSSC
jgi:hypothetical protein